MKRLCLALCALLLIMTACSSNETEEIIGLNLSGGNIVTATDTHGGFHGDGISYTAVSFEDDSALAEIQANPAWRELPLSEPLTALVYGVETRTADSVTSVGPYLTGEDGSPLFPQIENGYWYFEDRHADSTDPQDDSNVLKRPSFNLTVALYDIDTNMLHVCEFDT